MMSKFGELSIFKQGIITFSQIHMILPWWYYQMFRNNPQVWEFPGVLCYIILADTAFVDTVIP